MVGNSNMRARRKRAGALGQSARMFTLLGCTPVKIIPASQGTGLHNPSIGSMLILKTTLMKRCS